MKKQKSNKINLKKLTIAKINADGLATLKGGNLPMSDGTCWQSGFFFNGVCLHLY